MKDLYDFLPGIRPDLPGCSDPMIEQNLLQVVAAFCSDTNIWRYRPDTLTTAVGEKVYTLDDIPGGSVILSIISCLDVAGQHFQDYRFYPPDFELLESPTSAFTLDFELSLAPQDGVDSVEDMFFRDWYEEICSGTKAKLMIIPGKPWSNPSLAGVHAGLYRQGVGKARIRMSKQNSVVGKRVTGRSFF